MFVADLCSLPGRSTATSKQLKIQQRYTMLRPLLDNALLAWLQDESNDEFCSTEALTTMYTFFATGAANPLEQLQEDDRHHSFLIFIEDKQKEVVGLILHHLAQFPSRLGATAAAYDGR